MSAYWDNEHADAALIPAQVNVGTRGPSSVFLIGRKNMDGLDLSNSKNVYRAVGEALAAVTTDGKVLTEFNSFIKANWPAAAPAATVSTTKPRSKKTERRLFEEIKSCIKNLRF